MLVPCHRISWQNLAAEHPSDLEHLKDGGGGQGGLVDVCSYKINGDNSANLADN